MELLRWFARRSIGFQWDAEGLSHRTRLGLTRTITSLRGPVGQLTISPSFLSRCSKKLSHVSGVRGESVACCCVHSLIALVSVRFSYSLPFLAILGCFIFSFSFHLTFRPMWLSGIINCLCKWGHLLSGCCPSLFHFSQLPQQPELLNGL